MDNRITTKEDIKDLIKSYVEEGSEWIEIKDRVESITRGFEVDRLEILKDSVLHHGLNMYLSEAGEFYVRELHGLIRQAASDRRKELNTKPESKDGNQQVDRETATTFENKENAFNDLPIKDVVEYFKSELVEKGFLSEADLNTFIERAFVNNKPTKQKLRLKVKPNSGKMRVYPAFHSFFVEKMGKPKGEKDKYVRLLTDYFEWYDFNTVFANFSK